MGVIKVQPQSSKWSVNVFRSFALGWWVELEVKSAKKIVSVGEINKGVMWILTSGASKEVNH